MSNSYKYALKNGRSNRVELQDSITLVNPVSKGDKVVLSNGDRVLVLEIIHGEFMSLIIYAPESQTKC